MNRSVIAIAISAAMILSAGAAYAQKGPKGPKTHGPKTHGVKATTQGPKATTHGPKTTTTRGPKSTTHGGGKPTTTTTTTTAAAKGNKNKTSTTAATTTTSTTAAGTTLTLTPVQQKLQKNTNLASKLESRLPAGTNLMTAAEGFRNLGQFVAAVNVSNNLEIPFTTLKTAMVDDGMSLGQAIQSARNDVNVTTEVRRAETEATRIIADTETTTTVAKPKNKKKDGGE